MAERLSDIRQAHIDRLERNRIRQARRHIPPVIRTEKSAEYASVSLDRYRNRKRYLRRMSKLERPKRDKVRLVPLEKYRRMANR